MQGKAIRWLTIALEDLHAIGRYLAEKDLEAAKGVAQHIWNAAQSLTIASARGRPGRVANTRELVLDKHPYFLVYRVSKGQVQILRVLHTSRQYPA